MYTQFTFLWSYGEEKLEKPVCHAYHKPSCVLAARIEPVRPLSQLDNCQNIYSLFQNHEPVPLATESQLLLCA